MHRQRSRRGTKIPHNGVIDALLAKITETELAIQDLQAAIDGDGNGAGQLSAPQNKQASKHLLNRQRKIISQCQQLDKLQSVLRSGKCGLRVWTKAMTSLLLIPWTATLLRRIVMILSTGFVKCSCPPEQCRMKEPSPLTRSVKIKLSCGKLSTNLNWRTELPSASMII